MEMSDRERAELEYYRQAYGDQQQSAPAPFPTHMGHYGPPPAAQDALAEDEQAAFWPDDMDYDPKWEVNRRHSRSYSGWRRQGDE